MSIIAFVGTAAGSFTAGVTLGAIALTPRVGPWRGQGPTPAPVPAPARPVTPPPSVVVVQAAPVGTTALTAEDLATLAEVYGTDAAGFTRVLRNGTPAALPRTGGDPR